MFSNFFLEESSGQTDQKKTAPISQFETREIEGNYFLADDPERMYARPSD